MIFIVTVGYIKTINVVYPIAFLDKYTKSNSSNTKRFFKSKSVHFIRIFIFHHCSYNETKCGVEFCHSSIPLGFAKKERKCINGNVYFNSS